MRRPADSSAGAAVRAGIDDLIAEIEDGLNMLSNGVEVDLSGFDRRVESICEAAQRLDGDAALAAASALTELVDRLNLLTTRLESAQVGAASVDSQARNGGDGESERAARMRLANQAYRTPRTDSGRDDE